MLKKYMIISDQSSDYVVARLNELAEIGWEVVGFHGPTQDFPRYSVLLVREVESR